MAKRKKPFNPARKWAVNCWIGSAVGVGMFIYPLVVEIKTYGAGYALMFAGIIVFFSLLISGIVFALVAKKFDSIFSGKGLLAHWTYSPEEWARYTEVEHVRNKAEKWQLFFLITAIAVIVGIVFSIFVRDGWRTIIIVVPGLVALIAIVAYSAAAYEHWQNRRYLGEVYIGKSGALLNRTMHFWRLPASFLHHVVYQEGDDPYLELEYSAQSGYARGVYTARIPIPRGREDEARQVVAKLTKRGQAD